MNSDEENDIVRPESLPIYRKGKEIFDIVNNICALFPENDEYLNEIKSWMLSDAAQLTVKVAGAEAAEVLDHSIMTPIMTYHFAVLKRIPKIEKLPTTNVQYFNIVGYQILPSTQYRICL